MSDDELFDDDDSFAEAIANMDDSIAATDTRTSSSSSKSSSNHSSFERMEEPRPPSHRSGDDDDEEDYEDDPPSSKALKLLKHFYGYSSFRHVQWRIIRAVTEEKRDHCVVMATGSGKSLCYQFPALLTKKVSIVICPLISLMEDQVMALKV